ncbi:phytanoyl-CoA dioxygenase family protein [Frankia sp. Cj5]|uniref:phytanoyl-CoA dioxygenase family protein n=1 Tax=Frankia sp. Cj5 TaxID=2880978 RepID=UPI001EF5D7C9|nr:phytanoyl-CoA dioxygenase family protein [Frankia sp. Cj5]
MSTATAVPAAVLRRFPALARHFDRDAAPDQPVLFLHDDLVVRATPSRGGREVFRDDSAAWRAFCDNGFRLPAPTGREASEPPDPSPHEWNRDFRWRPITGPTRILDEAACAQYNEDGYCVLPDVVDAATVEILTSEVDRLEREGEERLRGMRAGRAFIARADEITFTTHIVRGSRFVRGFYGSELFQDIVHDIIGPDVRLYWDQAVYKKPHSPLPFPWHQDNGYTFVEPQQYLTCWIALTDSDESNGGLQLVAGAHTRGTLRHSRTPLGYVCYDRAPTTARSLTTTAGTVVCMSATTPHQTGPNTTGEVRRALVAQFVPDGAVAISREANGRVVRLPAEDPVRQFRILSGGRGVR